MSTFMSRREFFSSIFARRQAASDPCALLPLSPEFTPEALRAEAARIGLDTQQMTETEMAEAVLRAMYAQAPSDAGASTSGRVEDEADHAPDASANTYS